MHAGSEGPDAGRAAHAAESANQGNGFAASQGRPYGGIPPRGATNQARGDGMAASTARPGASGLAAAMQSLERLRLQVSSDEEGRPADPRWPQSAVPPADGDVGSERGADFAWDRELHEEQRRAVASLLAGPAAYRPASSWHTATDGYNTATGPRQQHDTPPRRGAPSLATSPFARPALRAPAAPERETSPGNVKRYAICAAPTPSLPNMRDVALTPVAHVPATRTPAHGAARTTTTSE